MKRIPILLIIMKAKNIFCILAVIIASVACISSCSKNEYDPEDYITSLLSGEYKKDGMWKLHVSLNGDPLENYGYVRFESKYMEVGTFRFVDVIPGISNVEYEKVPLKMTEEGSAFTITDNNSGNDFTIEGIVSFGEMTVNLKMP